MKHHVEERRKNGETPEIGAGVSPKMDGLFLRLMATGVFAAWLRGQSPILNGCICSIPCLYEQLDEIGL
jgi:hypothetical protein